MVIAFHFRHHDDVFRPEIGIVQPHGDRAAIVNGGMAGDNLFDILRIEVLSAHDQQVFLSADDIEFAIETETEVAGVIPAIDNRLRSEIRAIVVALKQTIALHQNFADISVAKMRAGFRRRCEPRDWAAAGRKK